MRLADCSFSVYCFPPVACCIAQTRLELVCVGALSFLEVNILCVCHCTEENNMQNEIIQPFKKKKKFYFCCRPGDDWKKTLKLPPKDLRIKTSVRMVELSDIK